MYRENYEKLKLEVQELLTDMEYHHQTDDDDTFHKWWREEGREAQYYRKREELDRLSFLARSDSSRDIAGKGKISYKNL